MNRDEMRSMLLSIGWSEDLISSVLREEELSQQAPAVTELAAEGTIDSTDIAIEPSGSVSSGEFLSIVG